MNATILAKLEAEFARLESTKAKPAAYLESLYAILPDCNRQTRANHIRQWKAAIRTWRMLADMESKKLAK